MTERTRKWPYHPGQGITLAAALAMFVGSFLPWVILLGKGLQAPPLAVAWTLWAGLMTLAGALVRWRTVVIVSGLAGGGTAASLAVWQTARVFDRCPLTLDCLPGPGVGLLLAAGAVAVWQAARLLIPRR